MFGKKPKQEAPLSEDQEVIKKVFQFPWALMFEDTPTGGIFEKLFPYISLLLTVVTIVIVAVKK